MAFLNFIFKDRQSEDDGTPEDPPSSAPAAEAEEEAPAEQAVTPPPDVPVPEIPDAMLVDEDDMDLEKLVEALQLISEFLGDEETVEEEEPPQEDLQNAVSIPFTLEQVSDLMTEAFDKKALAKADTAKMVHVMIEDVFAQLGRGRVTTQVKRMLNEVPRELLVKGFNRLSQDEVSLPLPLVVAAVQPTELENRTADEKTAADLDSMPDLFASAPAAAPAEAEVAEPEAEPEPVARRPDKTGDPFAMATPAAEPEAAESEDEDERPSQDGTLKFELNENANIFNFSASPVDEQPAAAPVEEPLQAPEEAEEPEPEPVAAAAEPDIEPVEEVVQLESADDEAPETVAEEERPAELIPNDELDEPEPADMTSAVFGPTVLGPDVPLEETEAARDEELVAAGDGLVLLSGIDLNQAGADELSSQLDGVGPRLAARIVRHREVNGPFRSIADLARVQGVGPSTFRKMTGQSWSEARDSLKRTLDYVLGSEGQDVPDLKGVARRIHSLSGFEGCVFAHTDGHMLAASWDDEKQDALGAVAPQMLKKMMPYVEELDIGELNPLTLCLGDTSICLLQSGSIIMATVHRAAGLGRRQSRLIELLGSELEQRFEVSMNF